MTTNHTAEPPTMAEIMRDEALAIAVDAVTQGKSVCLPTGTEADVCADCITRKEWADEIVDALNGVKK